MVSKPQVNKQIFEKISSTELLRRTNENFCMEICSIDD